MVRKRDETVYVTTKIPPKNRVWLASEWLSPDETFPGEYVRECTEQGLKNLFDQSPEDGLFHACQKHDIGVIAQVPFDEGALTDTITPETAFEEGDFRNNYFRGDCKREVYERVRAIVSGLGVTEDEVPAVALRYVLSPPAVSTVIPGMHSVRNVDRNMAVGDGKSLPEEQVQRLKAHRWVRNFYA